MHIRINLPGYKVEKSDKSCYTSIVSVGGETSV